mmetsp:Transcript_34794/g.64947  ORF Transcript_34794/g.64947 Transcript_34794/m.64947 type:complete len:143 (+) Transcript_34794:64-492(+)
MPVTGRGRVAAVSATTKAMLDLGNLQVVIGRWVKETSTRDGTPAIVLRRPTIPLMSTVHVMIMVGGIQRGLSGQVLGSGREMIPATKFGMLRKRRSRQKAKNTYHVLGQVLTMKSQMLMTSGGSSKNLLNGPGVGSSTTTLI